MKAVSRKKTRDHEAARVFSLTGNERYEGALQRRLEEVRVATVRVAEASDAEYLAENDIIIFDAHAIRPRQSCGAALWVCRLREKDFGTPFITLTWLPRRDIVNAQLAGDPFVGHFYKDSCRFLQLPVPPNGSWRASEKFGPVRKRRLPQASATFRASTARAAPVLSRMPLDQSI